MKNIPPGALATIKALQELGHEAYLAGGCVRDMLLERKPKDFDIATSATPEQVKKIFPRTVLVGEAFGVVRVLLRGEDLEVASFRSDGQYSDGRRPDSIKLATLKEDVERRDFTINAMMFDPIKGELIDHVGGQEDIKFKVIRTVGKPSFRFAEDRLRMLRAVRFAAQLDGFRIHEDTLRAIQAEASHIVLVSKERITQELSKIWAAPGAGRGWELLGETGLIGQVIPHHDDQWFRLKGAFTRLGEWDIPGDGKEIIGWALTMPHTDSSMPPRGEEFFRLNHKLSNQQIRRIMALNAAEKTLRMTNMMSSATVIRMLLTPDAPLYRAFQRIIIGWDLPSPQIDALDATSKRMIEEPLPLDQIPRGGDLLDKLQGVELGKALRIAEDAILERRIKTKEGAIKLALREVGA